MWMVAMLLVKKSTLRRIDWLWEDDGGFRVGESCTSVHILAGDSS